MNTDKLKYLLDLFSEEFEDFSTEGWKDSERYKLDINYLSIEGKDDGIEILKNDIDAIKSKEFCQRLLNIISYSKIQRSSIRKDKKGNEREVEIYVPLLADTIGAGGGGVTQSTLKWVLKKGLVNNKNAETILDAFKILFLRTGENYIEEFRNRLSNLYREVYIEEVNAKKTNVDKKCKIQIPAFFLGVLYPEEELIYKSNSVNDLAIFLEYRSNIGQEYDGYVKSKLFFKELQEEIRKCSELNPKDFLDIQGFIWWAKDHKEGYKQSKQIKNIVIINSTKNMLEEIKNLYKHFNNIILEGPPGTGKTFTAKKIIADYFKDDFKNKQFPPTENEKKFDFSKGAWDIVQFHPSYSYEDFVQGIVAGTTEDKKSVTFETKDKIFVRFCKKALENPESKFFLIIDEINRGDLSKIFGELIYGLEYRNDKVKTTYGELVIPQNLIIIGTMNTSDRSIALVDYALRRRFVFYKLLPDKSVLEKYYESDIKLKDVAIKFFEITQRLFNKETGEDIAIGHTYFLAESHDELKFKMEYQVKPLLEEYKKDGIKFSETELQTLFDSFK